MNYDRNEPLAYTILEACDRARASRSSIYEAIRSGELRAVKRGRATRILAADLENWIKGWPAVAVAKPAA